MRNLRNKTMRFGEMNFKYIATGCWLMSLWFPMYAGASVEISNAVLCQYTATSAAITTRLTDSSGAPMVYAAVHFSVVPDPLLQVAEGTFRYATAYTDTTGVAATVLSLNAGPYNNSLDIMAEDLSTGETASRTVSILLGVVCEISNFDFKPITAVQDNLYIATGYNVGWPWYGDAYWMYSVDPRVAEGKNGTVLAGPFFNQPAAMDIYPRQPGTTDIIVPDAFSVPVVVAPVDPAAPVVQSQPVSTATAGVLYTYQVQATSPSGAKLTFTLESAPMGMEINSQSGLITWFPAVDQLGLSVVKIVISDGKSSTYQHYRLYVSPGGPSPCIQQHPISQLTLDGGGQSNTVNATLKETFTGNIVSYTNNSVTVCNGTLLNYEATSTVGNAVCTVSSSPTASIGTVAPGDKLICTNKPTGQDTDRFRILGQ